ncbi:LacI family DNA-binding transcriptional regulator [Actinomyces faecalis]|uniref:LacI family DNA-binding transcriptional regulator n=1 Tax=Actinomyces faecalis TaxID=2722820 RepID=UPI001556E111|nr:LacI family DNA-binding transcriptional regulator [Actinomyces faecalis]
MASRGSGITQSDIAEAAGVSRSLVSLALSGSPKVAENTRAQIQAVACSLGYRVNASASALARRRSTTIGLILPNLRNAFFEKVARCLDDAAAQEGLNVFVAVGAENQDRLERAIDSLLGVRVLGLVLVSPSLTASQLREIGQETPTSLIGQQCPGGYVDAVHIDEAAAAREVVSHLISRGATSLAYIAPRIVDDASRELRQDALAQAARDAGISMTTWEGDGNGAGGAIRELLSVDDGVLGLVAHNDMLAIDAVAVLRDRRSAGQGRHPSPVLLVSYDNTYLARRSEFDLTSLAQPESDLAHEAIALLLRRAAHRASSTPLPGEEVLLAPQLIVRSSTYLSSRSGSGRPGHGPDPTTSIRR